ncbi:hypothetical protein AVEN_156589-1 [Araneus ventricosus]|uniref:Uncharacterized protein n=1 Tax=Araneus ventricosus TaxID=182803 RepID=A0A4Y2ETC8_ARAVE|nr:hypothetical protein AVEN_156589-1 [Araneus ventricosus]
MGRHARPTRGGNLLSVRNRKQTERQQLLTESSLAYPRGKEEKKQKLKREEKAEREIDTRAEIHLQVSELYEENMNKGMVTKWVIEFKDVLTNVHDEERSGLPSVSTEGWVQKVEGKVRDNRRFTISSLSNKFPQVSRSVLYGFVTEHLNYRKF